MAFDNQYNFFWMSYENTRHSENIKINNCVAITIFDSHVSPNETAGVYVEAQASIITNPEELEKVIALYFDRAGKPRKSTQDFLGDDGRRFYKAIPKHLWVNADGVKKRIEINLTELQG
jgi:hypothetical protein